jgi:Zn-dependent oligopeptidase
VSARDYLLRRCQMLDRSVEDATRWRAEARAEKEKIEDICAEFEAAGRPLSDYVRRQLEDARLQYSSAVALIDREVLKQSEAYARLFEHDERETAAAGLPQPTHVIEGQPTGRN